ncbi:IclR family transcriptional regulator [Thalassorhabdus alkalitolerans]|uniref:IclR family transcriptional regulator n=1 Tax=Thalassorhabdus alkalitolerans TaxID=2282697 RepID=A0ABW0YJY9_9BACI
MSSEKYRLSSVTNAMRILNIFKINKNKELSVTDIASQTNVPKSTAHRLITTLRKEGFLSQNPRTGKYRLGLALLTLGGVISVHKEIYREAFPYVEQLVRKIDETCHICLLEEQHVVYYYRVHRKAPEHLVTQEGRKSPVHCTSEGLLLLAFQESSYQERVLSEPLYRFTRYTITDPEKIRSRLSTIAAEGVAISEGEYFEGYTSISVPIRDYSYNVVSSLTLVSQTNRLKQKQYSYYVKQLRLTAYEISEALGYYGNI